MCPVGQAELLGAILKAYGIELAEISAMTGGLDSTASVYRAISRGNEAYFLKKRAHLNPGINLATELRAGGIPEVLAPIPTLAGKPALVVGEDAIILYPFIEGFNGFERPLLLEHWGKIGVGLRRIHEFKPPVAVLPQLTVERFEVAGLAEFEKLFAELATRRELSGQWKGLADVLQSHSVSVARVLRRTKELGIACRQHRLDLVPCHTDIHAGNVIVGRTGSINLIDWDAPRMAPRECDLMFFCGGGISGVSSDEETNFFAGYGSWTPNALLLTYYRYARAAEEFVAFSREATDPDSVDLRQKAEALRWLEVQFAPNMIVENAERSDAILRKTLAR